MSGVGSCGLALIALGVTVDPQILDLWTLPAADSGTPAAPARFDDADAIGQPIPIHAAHHTFQIEEPQVKCA